MAKELFLAHNPSGFSASGGGKTSAIEANNIEEAVAHVIQQIMRSKFNLYQYSLKIESRSSEHFVVTFQRQPSDEKETEIHIRPNTEFYNG